ncbi:aminomethyl-transferring glycine dehydrogenase [Aquibaculum sediminis]|uniref:aminomethyl-transferring glycine dehydrogenase n=1 Tax=Aquibaculum sediminis TaxID=3231907 RepID=UPI003456C655
MSDRRSSLAELEDRGEFTRRHIGPDAVEVQAMLKELGLNSLDELVDSAVPKAIRSDAPQLPEPLTEAQALAALAGYAEENQRLTSLIGLGYYDTFTPPVIRRNVLENPGWYTAYTPYQAEIAQGRLEALLNFQQMVSDLTGMELANASLLDEATAAAEAMTLMHRMSKAKSDTCFVADDLHPQTIAVLKTRAEPLGITLKIGAPEREFVAEECFGLILQYPNTYGEAKDLRALVEAAHESKALVTVASDLLALTLLTPPGEWGADVVVGSAQRFGVPLGYGGPHAAFMATREAYKRSVPGRIIGVSVDSHGNLAYRMALQTREQHIRREKATSNICTAQVLLAVMAGFYGVWHGPQGVRRIASRVHRLTAILADGLRRLDCKVETEGFFDTLVVACDAPAVLKCAREAGINLRPIDETRVGVSLDETTTREAVEKLFAAFAGSADHGLSVETLDAGVSAGVPSALVRQSSYMTHPVFNSYHSETEMLRYLRRLREKDVALDRSMIPLGSCTMKLNAAAEMLSITLPGFAGIHPFVPGDQAKGYRAVIGDLQDKLARLTGFSAISLQPNAGSQGEYAGLLAIRGWHKSRGEGHRNVCLIPSSAHGTNPASAVMAGMRVVVVNCDDEGNVDLQDLDAKIGKHADNLAALMITYPSTHGVFEETIIKICDKVHGAGGQVYMDGANLNALVGLCQPGRFGPDVAHLNLHKTFCIPHGGGGPGVGPIGVVEHLEPFLPNHPLVPEAGPEGGPGPVAAAPWGSASILPISWAYIAMTGTEGQTRATQVAILNANYVAHKLAGHYDVLYKGRNGRVAHECIIDTRPFKDSVGVSVDDIAKRLMDYGYHAPTMSWPVSGTLMIEPTESECREELDRFCNAMIAIRKEIARVEQGEWPQDDNPLCNAPHTAESVLAEDWSHAYSRERAVYPLTALREAKYWPPVGRIDNVAGDRNLVCTCPDITSYQEAAE